MISQINWQAVATIIAVLLAGALTAIGYLMRGREERRRILSVSLFHLLEVWNQLRVLSQWKPTDIVDVLFADIKRQMPSWEIPEFEKKSAGFILNSIWQPLLVDLMGKREQTTEKSFLDAIENLSKVDPLIAFRLSGNRTLKMAILSINDYLKRCETHLMATNPAELQQFQAAAKDAQEFIHDEVLRDLEKDLRSMALRIGITMWLRTSWDLRKKRQRSMVDFQKAIRPYIAKLLPHLQAPLTKSASAGSQS